MTRLFSLIVPLLLSITMMKNGGSSLLDTVVMRQFVSLSSSLSSFTSMRAVLASTTTTSSLLLFVEGYTTTTTTPIRSTTTRRRTFTTSSLSKSTTLIGYHSRLREQLRQSLLTNLFSTTTTSEEETAEQQAASSTDDDEDLTNVQSTFLKIMRDRGFFYQCTNLKELDKRLLKDEQDSSGDSPTVAYLGFDATADSLHVGSLLQIMILRHYQKCGHKPLVLIGGGTSKVGDPTGKDESRKLLTDADIKHNAKGISQVFEIFLKFESTFDSSSTNSYMVNNDEWLSELKYLEFLRDYGTKFTINRMLNFESVKQRLAREAPLTFLEFNYMILQAYDFLELSRRYSVELQMGGADQWGNIISGIELGRRCSSDDETAPSLIGLTAPLITTSNGKKMGKSEGGAIWLNENKLSPYDYWQFWRNTSDDDVLRFLKLFTEISLEEISEKYSSLQGAELNDAKIRLADEATTLLHGSECLKEIKETVEKMFAAGGAGAGATGALDSLPRIIISEETKIIDLLVEFKFASSKKEARRLIQGGGARLGDDKITDENAILSEQNFASSSEIVLRAGKKRAGVIEFVLEEEEK